MFEESLTFTLLESQKQKDSIPSYLKSRNELLNDENNTNHTEFRSKERASSQQIRQYKRQVYRVVLIVEKSCYLFSIVIVFFEK